MLNHKDESLWETRVQRKHLEKGNKTKIHRVYGESLSAECVHEESHGLMVSRGAKATLTGHKGLLLKIADGWSNWQRKMDTSACAAKHCTETMIYDNWIEKGEKEKGHSPSGITICDGS